MAFSHKSVLLNETIEGLRIRPDGIYVDGTLAAADIPMKLRRDLTKRAD